MEGQASGVVRMVEEGRSCEEVLQQIVALTAAADELSVLLIRDHVFERFGGDATDSAALADELARLLKRALRR
jgi:DNA-binding FrmR family transcriptional regulator